MAVDVALSWDLSPTTTSEVDGQRVYRTDVSSPTFPSDYTEIASVGDSQTTFTDTGVTEGQSLTYAVTAFNSAGESDPTTDGVNTTVIDLAVTSLDEDLGSITLTRLRQVTTSGTDKDVGSGQLTRTRQVTTNSLDEDLSANVLSRLSQLSIVPLDENVSS